MNHVLINDHNHKPSASDRVPSFSNINLYDERMDHDPDEPGTDK